MISRKYVRWFATVLVAATSGVSVRAEAAAPAPAPAPAPAKKPKWESTIALGFALTSGNSETMLASLSAGTRKQWDGNELLLGADGTYGESTVNGVNTVNANSGKVSAQYNRLCTKRFYGEARANAMFNEIADINYRVTLSFGAGYYFIKNKTADLCAEIGPGYIFENLAGTIHDYATMRVGEKFHYALSDRARLWQTAEYLPEVDYFNNYIVNAEIGIETDLRKDKKLTLRVSFLDTYDNVPAPGRKNNDIKLVTGIGYRF